MTPNPQQLVFETREEAKIAFEEAMYNSQESYNQIMEKAFTQWLSEEGVIIRGSINQTLK